jgi:hypothetical protein
MSKGNKCVCQCNLKLNSQNNSDTNITALFVFICVCKTNFIPLQLHTSNICLVHSLITLRREMIYCTALKALVLFHWSSWKSMKRTCREIGSEKYTNMQTKWTFKFWVAQCEIYGNNLEPDVLLHAVIDVGNSTVHVRIVPPQHTETTGSPLHLVTFLYVFLWMKKPYSGPVCHLSRLSSCLNKFCKNLREDITTTDIFFLSFSLHHITTHTKSH